MKYLIALKGYRQDERMVQECDIPEHHNIQQQKGEHQCLSGYY